MQLTARHACTGVEEAVRGFQERVAQQEAEQGVPHVSTFCAVRMRYVDDQLLDWQRGVAPPAAGSLVARQVGQACHGALCQQRVKRHGRTL